MNGFEYERLHRNLKLLKMITFDSILDNYLEIAAKEGRSTIEIIDYLIDQELQSKEATISGASYENSRLSYGEAA